MDGRVGGWMDGWMEVWMDGQKFGGTVCLIPAAFLGFCTVPGTEQVLDK